MRPSRLRLLAAPLLLALVTSCSSAGTAPAGEGVAAARAALVTDPLVLQATLGHADEAIGSNVVVDGDTAVVAGCVDPSCAGSVHVFTRSGTSWIRQATLTASDAADGDNFGSAMALRGDTLVVGASGSSSGRGAAYLFTRSEGTWSAPEKLTAADGANYHRFGCAVALEGDTLAVGASGRQSNNGAVYLFEHDAGGWVENAVLSSSDGTTYKQFGTSVALHGDTLAVGAPSRSESRGGVYVFEREAGTWTEKGILSVTGAAVGDGLGARVAVSEDTVVASAPSEGDNAGAVHLYERSGGAWSEVQELGETDGSAYNSFGNAVALEGDRLVVGAIGHGDYDGAAYLFVRDGGVWGRQQELLGPYQRQVSFGVAVAMSGETVVVGARNESFPDRSGARVFVVAPPGSSGTPCEADGECEEGQCVEGACGGVTDAGVIEPGVDGGDEEGEAEAGAETDAEVDADVGAEAGAEGDSGSGTDAGSGSDAGTGTDAGSGSEAAADDDDDASCGCRVVGTRGGAGASGWFAAAGAVALFAKRRRRVRLL